MLDNDDLDFAILASPASWIGLIVIIVVLIIVLKNHDECSKMTCERGKPTLVENDCHCLEKAK
jgi:hypothetical protein